MESVTKNYASEDNCLSLLTKIEIGKKVCPLKRPKPGIERVTHNLNSFMRKEKAYEGESEYPYHGDSKWLIVIQKSLLATNKSDSVQIRSIIKMHSILEF